MTLDRTLRQKQGKPGTDPHAGWCGRGAALVLPPMPIKQNIVLGL